MQGDRRVTHDGLTSDTTVSEAKKKKALRYDAEGF